MLKEKCSCNSSIKNSATVKDSNCTLRTSSVSVHDHVAWSGPTGRHEASVERHEAGNVSSQQ